MRPMGQVSFGLNTDKGVFSSALPRHISRWKVTHPVSPARGITGGEDSGMNASDW